MTDVASRQVRDRLERWKQNAGTLHLCSCMVQCVLCRLIITASRYTWRCHSTFSTIGRVARVTKTMFSMLLLGPLTERTRMTALTYICDFIDNQSWHISSLLSDFPENVHCIERELIQPCQQFDKKEWLSTQSVTINLSLCVFVCGLTHWIWIDSATTCIFHTPQPKYIRD